MKIEMSKLVTGVHHEFCPVTNGVIILKQNGGIEKLKSDGELIWSNLNILLYGLSVSQSYIYASDIDGTIYSLNENEGELITSLAAGNLNFVFDDTGYCFRYNRTLKITALFDPISASSIWEASFRVGQFLYSNQKIFTFTIYLQNNKFEVRNITSGALLWHFDVSTLGRYREWEPGGPEHPGEVKKFLGVWQGRLYAAVSNGLIIELDVESGQLLRSWQQLPDGLTLLPSGWNKLHGVELAFLDAAAGEIACVTHQYYWHIDLESGALHFHDLREHFSAAQLQVSPPAGDLAFDAEHIYFASEFRQYDGQSGSNLYQLAALHRRSARIVWQQQVELPQSCQWRQHPVLDGKRLYALSHDLARLSEGGTLHIFERTE